MEEQVVGKQDEKQRTIRMSKSLALTETNLAKIKERHSKV